MVENVQVETLSNSQSDPGSKGEVSITSTTETFSSNTNGSEFASLTLSSSAATERKLSPKCKAALIVLLALIAFATIAGLLLAINAEDTGKDYQLSAFDYELILLL